MLTHFTSLQSTIITSQLTSHHHITTHIITSQLTSHHITHHPQDCGFKVVTHMMPDLPNMGYERDILGFKSFSLLHLTPRELFENPVFRPDGLKLYPTLVIRGTGLYELWKKGQYRNYPPK